MDQSLEKLNIEYKHRLKVNAESVVSDSEWNGHQEPYNNSITGCTVSKFLMC